MANRFDDLRRDLDTAASDRTGRRIFGAATPDTAVSAIRTSPKVGVDANALVQDPTTLQQLDRTAADSEALRDAPKVRSFIDQNEINAAIASDELPALSGLERAQKWLSDSSQELFGWNRDDRFQSGFGLSVEGATKIGTGAVVTTRGFIASGRAVEAVEMLEYMQVLVDGGQPSSDQINAALNVKSFFTRGVLAAPDGIGTADFPNATPDQQVAMMSAVAGEFTDADADVTDAALMVALMVQQNPQGPALSIDNIPAVIGFYGVQSTALALPALIAGVVGGRQLGTAVLLGQGLGTGFAEATKRDILADGPAAFYSDETLKTGLVVAPMFAALDFLGPVGRVLRRPFAAIPEDLILKALRAKTLPKQVGAVLAGGALEEAVAEMGQEMLVDWGNGELDWTTEGITKYLEAAAVGALVGGPMTAVLEAPALVVQARRNSDAQRDGVSNSTLQQIQEQAGSIQLRERSPEKWREFLQAIGTDKGRMYIEGDALQAAVDAGTVDLALLGVAPDQVKTAIDAGGRVQISQIDWAANYAGTDTGQTVLDNSAARADGYTPAQLRNFEDLVAQADAESTFTAEQTVEVDKRTSALRETRRIKMRSEGMSQAEASANATLQANAMRALVVRNNDMTIFDQFELDMEGTSALGKQRAADSVSRMLEQPTPVADRSAEVEAQTTQVQTLEGVVAQLETAVAAADPEVRAEIATQLQDAVTQLEAAGVDLQQLTAAVDAGIAQAQTENVSPDDTGDLAQLAGDRTFNQEAAAADVEAAVDIETQEVALVARIEGAGGVVLEFNQLDGLVSSDLVPVLTAADLVGMKLFPTVADRTAAAALYTGIAGAQLDVAVPLLGGPLFPLRVSNFENDVVWANRGASVTSAKEGKLAAGATHMLVTLGDQNMHISNTTVNYAYMQTFFAKMGTSNPPDADGITKFLRNWQANADGGSKKTQAMRKDIQSFPSFDDKQELIDWTHRISFDARKQLMKLFSTADVQQMGGPNVQAILDATREQSLAGMNWGDGVLVLELDRGGGGGSFTELGTDGTSPHPDFPLGIRGRVAGRLETPLGWKTLWKDWVADNADKENPRRAFELSRPIVEVTEQLAADLANASSVGVQTPLHAKLVARLLDGDMRRTGVAKNKGGIGPADYFNEATTASAGSLETSGPIRADLKALNAGVKSGDISLAQVGDARIFYAIEGDRITSVVNNEGGTQGLGETVAVLDAVRRGAREIVAPQGSFLYNLGVDLGFTPTTEGGALRLEGDTNGYVERYLERGPAGLVEGRAGAAGRGAWVDGAGSGVELAGGDASAELAANAGIAPADGADTLASRAGRVASVLRKLKPEALANLGLTEQDASVLQAGSTRTLNQSATDTAAFKDWFGDSKVVDENGDPLVVYHGTPREGFEAFDPNTFGTERDAGFYGRGAYFAVSEGVAESYAETEDGDAGTVLATYLSVKNPYILDLSTEGWPETRQGLIDLGIRSASRSDPERGFTYSLQNREPAEFTAALENMGYDGVFMQDADGIQEIVVFEPAQIKSVDNVGTFDANDPRILNQSATDTAAFKEWFGDSKIVDENDEPRVVYHGSTARGVEEFDTSRVTTRGRGDQAGTYFTGDPQAAYGYTRPPIGQRTSNKRGSTTAAYIRLENPLNTTAAIAANQSAGMSFGDAKRAALEALDRGVHDGIAFDGDDLNPSEYVVFEPTQIKSVDNVGTFDANDPRIMNQEGARGQINLPENVRTGVSLIQLFESSDPSTMAHEFSHYLIEVMRSIGSADGAPQQITEDLEIVHAWMEETTGEAVDGNYSTAQQEAWAEAFENYLMSGVAPSPSLKVVFRKFALWLATVYKTAVGAGTQPSPEVRGVMDRLLATDQEIAAVQLENNDGAMFGDKPPFMSADEWETYRKVAERGDAEAQGKLLNRSMESARKKQTKEWKAFYAEALVAATADLSEEREYVLIAALGDKDNNFGRGARLDRDMLVSMFGTAILDDLKALKAPQLIYVKDGADIDQVADMFGFKNGAHMVQTLRTVKPMAEQAEANARAAADSLAPPLTPAEMQEEAEASLKNPTRIERVAREGAALSKASGGVASSWTVMNRAAKARAEILVGEMNVRQAGNYRQFSVAARKAAREAQTQLAKVVRLADGTPTTGGMAAMGKAAAAKRQQLLNDHMYNTARDRAKAFDKARKRFAKTDTKKGRAKIDPAYMDQADALLNQYDFRQRTAAQVKESTNARASLAAFILLQEEAGVSGELSIAPEVLLRGNVPLNYTELTVDALEAVVDAIDNLIHAGKAVQTSYLENQTLMYGDMVSEITTNMSLKMKAKARPDRESSQRSKIPKFLGALNHNIETALTTIRRMDGWEDNGPAMRFIFRPLQQAAAAVEERREQETVALKELYDLHYTKQEVRQLNDKRKHGVYVPELGDTFSKAGLLAIMLNTGNEGNFQRLTDVEGVKGNGAYDADRVNAAIKNHMTENDWRFVQGMWTHLNKFWPEIASLEREVSGVTPKQVDSIVQIEAPDFVTGGYYPIAYDADLNIASFLSGADDAYKDATGGRSGKAQTRSGHVESRLRSTGMALDLNLGVAENHIMKVTHDLAMRKPINHAVKMLNNKAIGKSLNTFGRTADLQALRSWLVDSAAGDSISADSMGGVMRYARKALTVKYIGFSLATLTLQPLGAIQAGVVVGNRNLAAAYVKYAGRAEYWNSFIQTNSAHMRLRVRAVNREVNEFAREARTAETAGSGAMTRWTNMITSASLAPIGHVQYWTVDIPVFIAAFEKARGEGVSEADAISLAENAVDRSSGSGSFLNRASFERGTSSDSARRTEYIKTFTMLASYVHSKYNAYVEVKGRTDFMSVTDTLKFSVSMMQLFVWEAVVVSLYRSIGDDSDDDEGTAGWLASTVGAEVVGLHPVTRPFSGYVSGYGTGTTPLTDFAELLADGVSSGGDIVTGEGDLRDWLNTFDAAATPFMLPTGQMNKIIKAITADEPAAQLGRVAVGLSPLRQ